MKKKEEMEATSNSMVYNKVRKLFMENNREIRCSRCPFHRGCNSRSFNRIKNWKEIRKTKFKKIVDML
jgi:hypothetical protein